MQLKYKRLIFILSSIAIIFFLIIGCIAFTFINKRQDLNLGNHKPLSSADGLKIASFVPDTLNPLYTANNSNLQTLKLIFEPLFKLDEKLDPIPCLASGYTTSEDGLKYTIQVKDNVFFHDNSKLTVHDIKATLDAVKSGAFGCKYKQNLENVLSIETNNSNLEIKLYKHVPNFLNLLQIPIVKVDSALVKEKFIPIGTGIYKFDSSDNEKLILKINKEWHGDFKKSPPDTIIVYLVSDSGVPKFLYDSDKIDMLTITSNVLAEKSIFHNTSTLNMLVFNCSKYNVDVRRAISNAVDRTELQQLHLVNLTNTFLNPNWSLYDKFIDGIPYDTINSREILKNNNIRELGLLVNRENEDRVRMAHILVSQLNDVGIGTKLNIVSFDEYITIIQTRKFDIYLGELELSPDLKLEPLLGEANVLNSGYSSSNMKQLISNTQNIHNQEVLFNYYSNIQEQFNADLPFLPLFFSKKVTLIKKNIQITSDVFEI